jgi:hypothetical protein
VFRKPVVTATGQARLGSLSTGGSAQDGLRAAKPVAWLGGKSPVASDPGRVKSRTLADSAESSSQTSSSAVPAHLLRIPEMQFGRIVFSTFCPRATFHTACDPTWTSFLFSLVGESWSDESSVRPVGRPRPRDIRFPQTSSRPRDAPWSLGSHPRGRVMARLSRRSSYRIQPA